MSGSATAGWSFNQNPMYLAQELTKRLGCGETKTSQLVYDCVKDADGQLMANRSNEINVSLCCLKNYLIKLLKTQFNFE